MLGYIQISANYMFRPLLVRPASGDTEPRAQTMQEPRASQDTYLPTDNGQTNIKNTYIYTNSFCKRPIFVNEISSPLTSMVV